MNGNGNSLNAGHFSGPDNRAGANPEQLQTLRLRSQGSADAPVAPLALPAPVGKHVAQKQTRKAHRHAEKKRGVAAKAESASEAAQAA